MISSITPGMRPEYQDRVLLPSGMAVRVANRDTSEHVRGLPLAHERHASCPGKASCGRVSGKVRRLWHERPGLQRRDSGRYIRPDESRQTLEFRALFARQ